MNSLSSFTSPANVAVVGASGGIGRAMCARLAEDASVGRVLALSRSTPSHDSAKIVPGFIDIEDEASVEQAARAGGDEPFDIVLVLSGILHDGNTLRPERRMAELSPPEMARVFAVNAIGPAIVAKHFLPRMRRRGKSVFAALSARVGSIGDNRLGGWASYRASKAALNQFVRTLSIEHARRYPDSIVVALHPGTVDTPLSKPYTSRTPAERLFDADRSAGHLLDVVDALGASDTGGFFAWDGSPIEY